MHLLQRAVQLCVCTSVFLLHPLTRAKGGREAACPDNMVTRNPGADSLLAWTRSLPSSSSGWNSGHQRVTSSDWLANPIHKHTHLISATSTGPIFLNNGEGSLGYR